MSTYTAPLKWHKRKDGLGVVDEAFDFWYERRGRRYTVHVPAGTVFNGASIPWPIRKLFGFDPLNPRWLKACIVHDVLVGEFGQLAYVVDDLGFLHQPNWFDAATIFDRALKVKSEGLSNSRRRLLVAGVRLWGVLSFKFI